MPDNHHDMGPAAISKVLQPQPALAGITKARVPRSAGEAAVSALPGRLEHIRLRTNDVVEAVRRFGDARARLRRLADAVRPLTVKPLPDDDALRSVLGGSFSAAVRDVRADMATVTAFREAYEDPAVMKVVRDSLAGGLAALNQLVRDAAVAGDRDTVRNAEAYRALLQSVIDVWVRKIYDTVAAGDVALNNGHAVLDMVKHTAQFLAFMERQTQAVVGSLGGLSRVGGFGALRYGAARTSVELVEEAEAVWAKRGMGKLFREELDRTRLERLFEAAERSHGQATVEELAEVTREAIKDSHSALEGMAVRVASTEIPVSARVVGGSPYKVDWGKAAKKMSRIFGSL